MLTAVSFVFAQEIEDFNQQIQFQNAELNKIRQEIKDFERELEKNKNQERSLVNQLQDTEKQISLTEKLLNRLNYEQQQTETHIRNATQTITKLETELATLKDRFAQRLVRLYKQDRASDWELILASGSLNQAIYRYKYLQVISKIDKQTAHELHQKINELESIQRKLASDLDNQKKIIDERKAQQKSLNQQKLRREKQLKEAHQNRDQIARQIQKKQEAAQQIQVLISRLEQQREARRKELERLRAMAGVEVQVPFLSQQGKLIWPVQGEITAKFGRQENPTLKIITENTGIDIRAERGMPVRAVFNGIVATITYIRGFGNMVIIDHDNSYYTVYTHIENVQVLENQYVSAGDVIAYVGDSSSLEGALLHFEIWSKAEKLDPELWLERKL
jgi:septal ring factor EnvC (AmiA/AmiB activator)